MRESNPGVRTKARRKHRSLHLMHLDPYKNCFFKIKHFKTSFQMSKKICFLKFSLEWVEYSKSRVAEVENSVKYLRRENEELKLDCEILRDQLSNLTSSSQGQCHTDTEAHSTLTRFDFQESK